MNTYVPTIGLEIHAELKTASKMFCGCKNAPHATASNTHICPVCMAHPGTLPVVNKEAVRHVLRVGAAVEGTIADFTEFDRKNYFYPDIPKNYQISQYKYPLVSGGEISGVAITRIHLEEDTARSSHAVGASLVDYNRAGVPLMELVTEPVMHDAEAVLAFAKELQLILRYLGASDANLEKGEMRIEVNVSMAKKDAAVFGTKVEVKNLNSFRAVFGATSYEIARQTEMLERGEGVVQETRGWDEQKQSTFSQRKKESAHDYRYFPDPDIPKYRLSEVGEYAIDDIRETLPELPQEVRLRLKGAGVTDDAIELLVGDVALRELFFHTATELRGEDEALRLLINYITSDLVGIRNKYENIDISDITPEVFAEMITLVSEGILSSRGAKNMLEHIARNPKKIKSVREIAEQKGLLQVSDTAMLEDVILKVISEYASVVEEFRSGKENALQFLVGQCMRATKGAGNPEMIKDILNKKLK